MKYDKTCLKGNILRGLLCVIALGIITVLIILGVWYFHTPTDGEYMEATASLERTDRYFLTANGDTVMVFSDFDGNDLLKEGIAITTSLQEQQLSDTPISTTTPSSDLGHNSDNSSFNYTPSSDLGHNSDNSSFNYTPVSDFGLWVNSLPGFPSCQGRIAILGNERAKRCNLTSDALHRIIQLQESRIQHQLDRYDSEFKTLDYYMKTHNVIDQGFDLVVRYEKKVKAERDSMHRVMEVLANIKPTAKLKLLYSPLYSAWVKTDSSRVKVTCAFEKQKDSLLVLRTSNAITPNAGTRLSIYNKVLPAYLSAKQKFFKPTLLLAKDVRIDSLGVYTGEMDSLRMSHGFGALDAADSSYYEGEWIHGKREGFGFAMTEKHKLKVGEWKDDRYLGERINYTNERIYGIDIARYQHEEGRKRYSINWNALRITSLGSKSRKTITGTVDYPVSFIYIKSTEGTSVRNKYFANDYKQAHAHGYYVGAYHFFSTKSSGAAQARYFVNNTRYRRGDFPPVLDVEPSHEQIRKMGGAQAMFRQIRAWLNYVESVWHVRPVLYVGQNFVNRYLPSAPDLMKNYDVWIARYGEYKPDVNLVYWQLCPDGRVRGIHGAVDINVFNGYEKEFKAYVRQ